MLQQIFAAAVLLTMTSALEVANEEEKIEKSSKKYPSFQVVLDDETVDLYLSHPL